MASAMALLVLLATVVLTFAITAPQAELPTAPPTKLEVLEYEVKSLKAKNSALEDDKQQLLGTIRGMLFNNQTAVLQRQLNEVSHRGDIVEERSAQQRLHLQAEAKEADRKAEAAASTAQEAVHGAEMAAASAREVIRKAKEENVGFAKLLRNTQLLLEEEQTKTDTLRKDKQHLLEAMSGVLRQNEEYARNATEYARNGTAEKHKRERKKKDSAAAKEKLVGASRGRAQVGALHVASDAAAEVESSTPPPSRPRLRRATPAKEDPVAYMGDTRTLTAYIANYRAKAWAAKEAGNDWIDPVGQPGGDSA